MTLHNHNGTLVIHNPEGEYDYQALVEEWKDKMNELPDLPVDLDEFKASVKAKIEEKLSGILYSGFEFNGQIYPADQQAQIAAMDADQDYQATGDTSVLGAFCKANTWVAMDSDTFKLFRVKGREFVRGLYAEIWELKHTKIAGASTVSEVQAFFDAWVLEVS